MEQSTLSPYGLLCQCSVRVSVSANKGHGTGFFVAPGVLLTCAHVVRDATSNRSADVYWESLHYPASITDILFEQDLALLQVDFTDHPCVYLDPDAQPFDTLYSYGFPDDHADGDPASFTLEGWSGHQQDQLKFKVGQVRPGMSGSPLLNMRTGRVCGIIQLSRDRSTDLGGRAIPITVVYQCFKQLENEQQQFHARDSHWRDTFDTPLFKGKVRESAWNRSSQRNSLDLGRADWGESPSVDQLFGREHELAVINQWVVGEHCRIAAVLGIGGIGKTALVKKLAEELKPHFNYIFWRSLQNAPSLKMILEKCILFLSGQEQIDLPDDINDQISVLIEYLRVYRCLLILDNAETILQVGDPAHQYQSGYENYARLITRIGESEHQSCLIMTSREKPQELTNLEATSSFVRSLQLPGLGKSAGQEILQDKKLNGTNETWDALINFYAGNPLALKMVSDSIRNRFYGDIAQFLENREAMPSNIYHLLDQQFRRLSKVEQDVLYWLALKREEVSIDDIQKEILSKMSKMAFFEMFDFLRERSFIELSEGNSYSLQPVIMEYITYNLIDRIFNEIETETLGLLGSHPLVTAQAKDYIRNSQISLILTPLIERLQVEFGKAESESRLKAVLQKLRQQYYPQSTYAAGNVFNLLIQLGCDFRGYNFSSLTVRHAYLRDVALPDVDFSFADLSKSIFADTFGSISSVAISPTGQFFAAGTDTGEILIWQSSNGILLLSCIGHTDSVRAIAFSHKDGSLVSASDDGSVRLWETGTGDCLKVIRSITEEVKAVAFSPDDTVLAFGGSRECIELWNIVDDKRVKILPSHGHTGWIRTISFSQSGKILASGSDDMTVCIWDVSSGRTVHVLRGHTDSVCSVAFGAGESILASGSDDCSIRLWNVSTGECLKVLSGHTGGVTSVAFNTGGTVLASGSKDTTARLWEISTGYCFQTLQGHKDAIRSVAFNSDGKTLASGGDDRAILLWEVSTGYCIRTLQGYTNAIWSVTFSPDGKTLASGGDDRAILLWEVSTGHKLKALQGHARRVNSIAFSQDGKLLVSKGDDMSANLWDVNKMRFLKTLTGHISKNWYVGLTDDGDVIVNASNDPQVQLWKISLEVNGKNEQKQPIVPLSGVTAIAYSPDRSLLATAHGDMSIKLWETSTGLCLHTLQGKTHWIWCVVFSPDGRVLASGSNDGVIKLWDVSSGSCLHTMRHERQYERMNITGVKGLTSAQIATLKKLGAIQNDV